jgi:hypothetical protein
VYPLDITTVTEEQLKVSHLIRLKSPPTWRSLEKESNKVYAGEALERAKLVPADFDSVLQPKGFEKWVFDGHHVSSMG